MIALLSLLEFTLYLAMLVMMLRLILDWVQSFARAWRPQGIMLVVASTVYFLTDPPLRALRRVIPPLNLGGISLDLGFLILILVIGIARSLIGAGIQTLAF